MNYIKKLYSGRIGRKNYGLGLLFLISFFILLIAIFASMLSSDNSFFGAFIIIILYVVYIVFLLSLHVRRFHDLGDSGWRVLLFLIPLVNLIILISLLATKGKDETNKYGEAPSKSIKFFDAIFNRNQSDSIITDNQNKDKNNQYCAKCGTQIESNSKFCYKCGTKVITLNE